MCQWRHGIDGDLFEGIQMWLVECCLKIRACVRKGISLLTDEEAEHLHHWQLRHDHPCSFLHCLFSRQVINLLTFASAA